jgi:hypothetical protein
MQSMMWVVPCVMMWVVSCVYHRRCHMLIGIGTSRRKSEGSYESLIGEGHDETIVVDLLQTLYGTPTR